MEEKIDLESFSQILDHKFLDAPKRPKTFLEIAKMPHYENVDSNLLAFFFDHKEEHGFKDLFLKSLLELVNRKTKETSTIKEMVFRDWEVHREVTTKDRKRIDIVIESISANEVIIIENKIYHFLANDLEAYLEHYSGYLKVGIVLSLNDMNVDRSGFINITHKELVEEIQQYLGKYLLDSNEKYLTFLKDYISNTLKFYQEPMEVKNFEFYFKHSEKVNRLAEVRQDAIKYLFTKVEDVGPLIDLEVHGKKAKDSRYFPLNESHDLYFAVFLTKLLSEGVLEYELILEGYNLNSDFKGKAFDAMKPHINNEKGLLSDDKSPTYPHFLRKTYHLDSGSLEKLDKEISKNLKEEFWKAKEDLLRITRNSKEPVSN